MRTDHEEDRLDHEADEAEGIEEGEGEDFDDDEDEPLTEDQAFESQLDEDDPEREVYVSKLEGSSFVKVGQIPVREFKIENIPARFGDGQYRLRIRHTRTKKWGKQLTAPLRRPPAPPPPPAPAPPPIMVPTIPAPAGGGSETVLVAVLQGMMAQTTALVQAMASQSQARTSPATNEIIEAIKLGQSMAAPARHAGDDDDDDDGGGLGGFASLLSRFLGSGQAPAPAALPAAPAAPSGPPEFVAVEHVLRAAIASPRPMPETWADAIIGAIGRDTAARVTVTPGALVGLIVDSYPDLKQHEALLLQIEEAMRAKVQSKP